MEVKGVFGLAKLCMDRLSVDGLGLAETDDISEFEREMSTIGKAANHPMTSANYYDFATADAFGLFVRGPSGEIVGGMSARIVRLGRDSLATHLEQSYARLYSDSGANPVHSRLRIADEISGNVTYQGELYLHPEWRGGRVNVAAVMHYAHLLSALKWQPDWIYAFMRIEGISHAARYGFTRQHVGALLWSDCTPRRSEKECLVALNQIELHEVISFYLANPDRFALRKDQKRKQ